METWRLVLRQGILLVLLQAAVLVAGDFPIHCPRDNKLETCLGSAMQTIVRRFRAGLPEVRIPSVDPLKIPKIDIKKKAGSVLDVHITFLDLIVKDITINATVTSLKFAPEKFDLLIETFRPVARFNGKYTSKGKLLWLPIWGTGTCTMEMRNIVDKFHISGEGITKEDGKKYWEVTHFKAELHPKDMELHFHNLYNGNKLLGVAADKLINSQWRLLYSHLGAWSDEAYSNAMKPHWKNLFLRRPFDDIFPPHKL